MPVKIYGAKRTGTNYIYQLLTRNFKQPVFISLFGWKHGPPPEDPLKWWDEHPKETRKFKHVRQLGTRLRYVICIKDPYSMCVSNIEYTWRFFGEGQDRSAPGVYRLLCNSFNKLYQTWWDFMQEQGEERSCVFRYEDALADYRAVLRSMEERFKLARKHSPLQDLRREALPGTDGHTHVSSGLFKRQAYYEKRHYLLALTPDCKQMITDTMDWDLMARFGYTPEKEN
jgi:hypothetical protein